MVIDQSTAVYGLLRSIQAGISSNGIKQINNRIREKRNLMLSDHEKIDKITAKKLKSGLLFPGG